MAKGHKPRAGSKAYWPRKRAKRIYPRIKAAQGTGKEVGPLAFAAYKAGMTSVSYSYPRKGSHLQGKDLTVPVTVFDAPALVVFGVKAYRFGLEGLEDAGVVYAEKIDKNLKRKTSLPKKAKPAKDDLAKELEAGNIADIRLLVHTKPLETGIGKKRPEIFEIPIGGDVKARWEYALGKLGSDLKAEEVLKPGEMVDVRAVTKGKGMQGPVKRFGVKIRSRKNQGKRRHTGPMGPRTPARVLPGVIPQTGQMGFQTRTELNKRVVKIGSEAKDVNPVSGFVNYGLVKGNYVLVKGSVPGVKKRLVMLRKAARPKEPMQIEVKEIHKHSQQG